LGRLYHPFPLRRRQGDLEDQEDLAGLAGQHRQEGLRLQDQEGQAGLAGQEGQDGDEDEGEQALEWQLELE
jgi:hypothetical protein